MKNRIFRFTGKQMWLLLLAALLLWLAACGGDEAPAEPDNVAEVDEDDGEAADEAPPVVEPEEDEPTAVPTPQPEPTEEPEPTAEPTPEPLVRTVASGEYVYSNGNQLRDVALFGDSIWAAGPGGLIRYDLPSGDARKYTTLDGLPNIGTFALEVCPVNGEDRLIVGSRDGLLLYNAANDSWEPGSSIGFSDETAIHEMRCDAANGRLILAYDDLSVLDLASGTMTHYTEDDDGLAWFALEQVIVIGDDIWAPTDFQGISRVGLDGTVETLSEALTGFPDDSVSDVTVDGSGVYWFGTSDGLLKLENGTFTMLTRETHPDVIDFFGPDHVETAVDGTLWLGFNSDLCNFDPATATCTQRIDLVDDLGFPPYSNLARLEVLADGRILLHTYDEGLAYFDGANWTRFALENEAPSNFYAGITQTSDGTIWVYGDSLYTTDVAAQTWELFPDIYPNDLVEAPNGDIWMLTSYSVVRYNGAQLLRFDSDSGLLDTTYNRLAIDAQGVVYAVGYDGYSIIDGETITAVGPDSGWDFGNIRDVLVVDGVVYAATVNGLASLEGSSHTVLLDETFVNLPNANIASLGQLSDGTLLLGTVQGLATYKDGVVTAVPEVAASVSNIFVTPDDQIHVVAFWSGLNDGGYFHYDGSSWNYRPDTDFPMTSLRTVMVDNEGTVWIGLGDTGLGGGIFRIVP
ncbi:MAG: hypothetical protein H6654_08460 [Ardenticatenaceae bacterium]|nr:hypothetical protein [Anaerolineales bacterium]MCB8940555.1 hypothetical protein [Ardenticatenaceae bacterium]MCB8973575.1 hypothetical protein [Ardenticatenaceae bacterium]